MASEGSSRGNSKKRTRPSFLLEDSTPSDPALFSSDPPDPSAEHYFSPRPKKQYRGTWWQNVEQGRRVRKAFQRNMDSGVFMGSDSSLESLDIEEDPNPKSDDTVPDETAYTVILGSHAMKPRPVRISEPPVVSRARKLIAYYAEGAAPEDADDDIKSWFDSHYSDDLESWQTSLKLSGLGLPHLSDDMILPLFHLVKSPTWIQKADRHSVNSPSRWFLSDSDADFETLSREIVLELQGNALTELPPSLFGMPGLSELNIHHNNLSAVPPTVCKARGLERLDVSGNRLRWLPGEILDLLRDSDSGLLSLWLEHNPLLQPFLYVGFHERIGRILDDSDHNDTINGSGHTSLIPGTITMIKGHIERLQQWKPAHENERSRLELLHVQRSWLRRLYEHFLAVPELTWRDSKWTSEHIDAQFSDLEREEIIARWACSQHVFKAAYPRRSVLEDPLSIALVNLDAQLNNALHHETFFIAATQICYLDMSGRPINSKVPPPSELPLDEAIMPARLLKVPKRPNFSNEPGKVVKSISALRLPPDVSPTVSHSPVRSLFSLCLRSASSRPELALLPGLLPDDVSPTVQIGLGTAIKAQKEGGRVCSACSRPFIIPRAEWIEYHYIHHIGRSAGDISLLFIPFLRRVCSWACVPHLDYDD